MDFANPMTLKGLFFTSSVVVVFLGLTWWFYLSPLRYNINGVSQLAPNIIHGVVVSLGVSAASMIVGGLWDASMHIQTGEVPGGSDFLWPPHLVLYSGFLIAFITAGVSLLTIGKMGWRTGMHDPRAWVRSNPYLGAVVLCSGFTMLSIPSDAIWHELIGIDLTAWSPPHILLGLSSSMVLVSAIGVLFQQKFNRKTIFFRNVGTYILLGLMLNLLYILGVLEWELPGGRSPFVEARPIWMYPSIAGILAFFAIVLAKRLTRAHFAGTSVAFAFYAIRLAVTTGLSVTGNVVPIFPLPFILGAFMVDIVHWDQIRSAWLRVLGLSVSYTLGYAFLAFPILFDRWDLPSFSTTDVVMTLLVTTAGAAVFVPLTRFTGRRLAGRQPVH